MDRFEDGSLDDNVESFLSHNDVDPRDTVGRCMDVNKGVHMIFFPYILQFMFQVVLDHDMGAD